MASAPVVIAEDVSITFGTRHVLSTVTVGVNDGARIGVVGRNGGGKSTLLRILSGDLEPDEGRVVRAGGPEGLRIGVLAQADTFGPGLTAGDVVVGARQRHEWASDPRIRDVLAGLLGGVDAPLLTEGLDTLLSTMSGGERRRCSLAGLLADDRDVIVLDEPTNHLDIEAVDWLAHHLVRRNGTLVVVTHDRWFLDEVCTDTWEVVDGSVHRYAGGYAAYVLAKAERERVAATVADRRSNLLRKELAWLRRGPPARTSKPRFRIDAANALIADEPPPRDRLELQRFATARLGRQVYDLESVTLRAGGRVGADPAGPRVLTDTTWGVGPGDRIGLLGPNGAGKSTLLSLLAAGTRLRDPSVAPMLGVTSGRVGVGKTVVPALLAQDDDVLDPQMTVLESVRRVREVIDVGKGRTLTASQLLETFGFSGERLVSRVGDLSGGERRRLTLLTLVMDAPNVLMLDEPTNDLDIEMLTILEDFLDSWPGTLIVVSHDRFFLERVTDDLFALLGDGRLRHLPGGVDEYLARRRAVVANEESRVVPPAGTPNGGEPASIALPPAMSGGAAYATRKELSRLERRIEKLREEEATLHELMAEFSTDFEQVATLDEQLRAVSAQRESLEEEWLELAEALG